MMHKDQAVMICRPLFINVVINWCIYTGWASKGGGALLFEKYFNAVVTAWSNTAEMLSITKHIFLYYYYTNYELLLLAKICSSCCCRGYLVVAPFTQFMQPQTRRRLWLLLAVVEANANKCSLPTSDMSEIVYSPLNSLCSSKKKQ